MIRLQKWANGYGEHLTRSVLRQALSWNRLLRWWHACMPKCPASRKSGSTFWGYLKLRSPTRPAGRPEDATRETGTGLDKCKEAPKQMHIVIIKSKSDNLSNCVWKQFLPQPATRYCYKPFPHDMNATTLHTIHVDPAKVQMVSSNSVRVVYNELLCVALIHHTTNS